MFHGIRTKILAVALAVCLPCANMAFAEPEPQSSLQEFPLVALADFDFSAATTNQIQTLNLGKGVADMVGEAMLKEGAPFRVMDRKWTASQPVTGVGNLGARYLISGSVTKFGTKTRTLGIGGVVPLVFLFARHIAIGSALAVTALASGVGRNKQTARVTITARIVDVRNGVVVASVHGDGKSNHGGVRTPIVSIQSSDFRESALGEATELAVTDLVKKLEALAPKLASNP